MKYLLLIPILCLQCCVGDLERVLGIHEWKTYTIDQGKHYCNGLRGATWSSDHIDFKARFNETAIYTATTKAHQFDINKLCGFTDCNSEVEGCSARFGWRWSIKRQKIEILSYTHSSGQFYFTYMGDAEFNQEQSYSIYCVGDHYNFNFNGNLITMPRECGQAMVVRALCYPFFGGNDSAPHNIQIQIKLL